MACPSEARIASFRGAVGHAAGRAADSPYLPQRDPPLRSTDPASRKLGVLPPRLRPHKEAFQLLGRDPRRPRPAEWVEDEVPFRGGGEHGAAEETQGFLGGVAAVGLLPSGHGGDVPYGGDLGGGIGAVYEVVVEGVARAFALARPQECFVGVGEGGVEDVRWWVWFGPGDLVYKLEVHALEREAEAEDDVVRAR